MKEMIHIGLACDNGYAQHTGVTIQSVLANCKHPEELHLHIINDGIKEENKLKLKQVVNSFGAHIEFITVDKNKLKELNREDYLGVQTYYRLLLPEVLPKVNKLIYLDSDLIIEKDIAGLWSYGFDKNIFLAVPEAPVNQKAGIERLNIPKEFEYFIAGVLVIDCDKYRKQHVAKKVLDYAMHNKEKLVSGDQDALNATMYNNWKAVPYEWDVCPHFYFPDMIGKLGRDAVKKLRADPAIIHYTGPVKPWHYLDIHPLKNRYWHYLEQTPWKDYEFPDKNIKNRFKKIIKYALKLVPYQVKAPLFKSRFFYRIFTSLSSPK